MENIIINEELKLKPIDINDMENMRKWRNEENKNSTFVNTKFITEENQLSWYNSYKNSNNDMMFIIVYRNIKVGMIGLYEIDYDNKKAEFGRLLIGDKNFRGKNLGFECTKALCQYGINNLSLNKIKLEVFKNNDYAVNVYKKVGFKTIGEIIENSVEMLVMEYTK